MPFDSDFSPVLRLTLDQIAQDRAEDLPEEIAILDVKWSKDECCHVEQLVRLQKLLPDEESCARLRKEIGKMSIENYASIRLEDLTTSEVTCVPPGMLRYWNDIHRILKNQSSRVIGSFWLWDICSLNDNVPNFFRI